jgi:hypothetical protein
MPYDPPAGHVYDLSARIEPPSDRRARRGGRHYTARELRLRAERATWKRH